MDILRQEKYYTYEDWLNLDDGHRYELLDGELYMMAEPSRRHQEIQMEMSRQIANYLVGKPCRVYPAPFGVRLFKGRHTAFEPDITVVCDRSKLTDQGCEGAPDLVVEILSPSTARFDKFTKFNEYLRAGVREYWIVDPDTKTVNVFGLKEGEYMAKAYGEADTIQVHVLDGCVIDLPLVFAETSNA